MGFKFSFAVDYSSLPYSNSYLENINNYSCNKKYEITNIRSINNNLYNINEIKPTHLITVFTKNHPVCELEVSLKNVIPAWIDETNIENELNIKNDSSHTFGFKVLTNGISEAYNHINNKENIDNFQFKIKN